MRLDRAAYWTDTNRAWSIAAVCLLGAIAVAFVGPAASHRSRVEATRADQELRYQRWQRDFQSYHPIDASERQAFDRVFADLERWLPEADSEPRRIAALARFFEVGSTRDFHVEPGLPLDQREVELSGIVPERTLHAPNGVRTLVVEALPVVVGFKCTYSDMRHILRRLQSKEVPVLVEDLKVQRLFNEVEVRLDLVFLLQDGVAS